MKREVVSEREGEEGEGDGRASSRSVEESSLPDGAECRRDSAAVAKSHNSSEGGQVSRRRGCWTLGSTLGGGKEEGELTSISTPCKEKCELDLPSSLLPSHPPHPRSKHFVEIAHRLVPL